MVGSKRPAPGTGPSAQKKPKHARGRRTEAGELTETAQTASVMVEDTVDQDLEGAFLGTMLLDVRLLNTQWDWDKNRRNRDVQPGLVARLKEAFKNGIKRYAIEDHLKATTTEPEFDGLLKANLPNSTGSSDSDLSYVRNRAATHSGLKATMLHIENLPYKTQLTLRNGQHRVRALIELCNEQRELAASGASDDSGKPIRPPGDEDYLWAVGLYDNNKLTSDALAALISNREIVRQTNSEGYNALNIITYLDQLDDTARAERLKANNFKRWLNTVFGVNLTYATRMITILKDKSLSNLIRLYCGTRYGENSFNWSLMARIQAGKQTEMWALEFERFFTFCSTIFGSRRQNVIEYNDWKLILSLDQGRPISQLRLLFFPKPEDYWVQSDASTPKRNQPFPISNEYAGNLRFPKLESPIVIQNQEFTYRRPGFLANLSERSYKAVFTNLHAHPNLECPTWGDWVGLEKTVSSVASKILHHIMVWVEPTWKLPSKSSHEWIYFSWLQQIKKHLFPDEPDSAPSSETKEWEFLQGLWDTISNENSWQDADLQSLLKEPESTIGSDGEERQRYLSRFRHIHWIEIVKLVSKARPNCLQGFMSDFNDHDRLTAVYEPYTPWGEIFCKTNFSQNRMLQKTPCLNTKAIQDDIVLQGEIFGAFVHYRHLKQQMILTLKWGWEEPATENPARPSGLIASPEEYDTAVEVLTELAALLVKFGYRPEIDNWNENLASFTMDRSQNSRLQTDIPAKAGFLTARPPAVVHQDDEARAMARTLPQSIVRNRLERPLPRRDRTPSEESTI
ncbi:ubiquitin-conjugating enzyme E2 27 [Aspergillus terreus]|uniref:Ubiquitin-conjugating enzyme E2 27 n=1 Tax=Aspergillus terreus TaxID=33178 RepID=A0A5M3Z0A8_ASPTE|nr:hypothetical protein ATETN484_0006037700 [Aspergillus terreus]GFF12033.1 ubiquitin-conjugating enzyme E2 27 [Aspergillus terreus]